MSKKKILSMLVCVVLVILALGMIGCGSKKKEAEGSGTAVVTDGAKLGEGSKTFKLSITDAEGTELKADVSTDKETVGEALLELGVIDGEEGDYGLYITTVNGVTVEYEKDGKYWAFYIDGQYAMEGADLTEINEGSEYAFKVE